MRTISFIGAGNVATHLANAVFSSGFPIEQVFSRSWDKAANLAHQVNAHPVNKWNNLHSTSDLYIVAVSDEVVQEIGNHWQTGGSLVVHTSGSVAMEALQNCSDRTGVLYPLQTFTTGREIDLNNVPFCLEAAHNVDLERLQQLCDQLNWPWYSISTKERQYLHLAAVIVNNFSNHLFTIAEDHIQSLGLDFQLLAPLAYETVAKAVEIGPVPAQTGPAKRGDKEIINKHLAMLEKADHRELYGLISKAIYNRYHPSN